jgi:hypothetical protein
MNRCTSLFGTVLVMGMLSASGGCDKKPEAPAGGKTSGTSGAKPGDKHDDHGHGPTVELGSTAIGSFQAKASRDGGITAGEEAAVDLWVTASAGAKIGAVRAWIGTQDAKGSTKAKMELEKDNYHNHVEVPKPLPEGSKLWVELEDDKGVKALGSFDLKS